MILNQLLDFRATLLAAVVVATAVVIAAPQGSGDPVVSPQVAAGRAAYAEHCASCHAPDLRGSEAPPLIGSVFSSTWGSRSAKELLDYTSATMPQGGEPLSADVYASIVAFIRQSNGLIESRGARLLVLLRSASALAVVDPLNGQVLGRVPVVRDPHEVTVTPDGVTAFVGSPTQGISVVDLRSMKELRRVDPGAGSAPHDVLFRGGKLYFTAEGYKTIGRYDLSSERVEWMVGIGQDGTHLLALSGDQQTLWVPNRGSNSVSVIDGAKDGPPKLKVTTIPVPGMRPEGLDLSPDGRELWTATRGDGSVSIVDTATRTVVASLPLKLKDANRLKFTPDGRALILDGGSGSLVVLDGTARKEVARIKVSRGDSGDGGLFVRPDGARAYVGLRNDNAVVVVNLQSLEVETRFVMGDGSGPSAVTWSLVPGP